jgi:hypothetical protein
LIANKYDVAVSEIEMERTEKQYIAYGKSLKIITEAWFKPLKKEPKTKLLPQM